MATRKTFVFLAGCILILALSFSGVWAVLTTDPSQSAGSSKLAVIKNSDNGQILHNPLMGWQYYVIYPDEITNYGLQPEFDVITLLTSWDRLEPQEGVYDWTRLDKELAQVRAAGRTAYLRFYLMPDEVWKYGGTPEWIWSKGVKRIEVAAKTLLDDDYTAIHPDYTSNIYQEKMSNFLKAFAEKYPDGSFDVIDALGYGMYGEWDTGWGKWDWNGDMELKTNTLNRLVDIYNEAFGGMKYTKLAVCLAPSEGIPYEEYKQQVALDTAMRYGWGLRYNGIGDKYMPDLFPSLAVNQYFPQAPVFGETWYGWSSGPEDYDKLKTVDSFLSYRMNSITFGWFSGCYMPLLMDEELYNKGMLNMGYRLLPKMLSYPERVSSKGTFVLKSVWENRAVGVCYRKYPLQIILKDKSGQTVFSEIDQSFDQTLWIKGATYRAESVFKLPPLPKGKYTLHIALVDERTGKPAIALPIEGNTESREYPVGTIQIGG